MKKRKDLPRGSWSSLSTLGDKNGEEEENAETEGWWSLLPLETPPVFVGGSENDTAPCSALLLAEDLALSHGLTAPTPPNPPAGSSPAGGDLPASHDPSRDSFSPPSVGSDDGSVSSVEAVSAAVEGGGGGGGGGRAELSWGVPPPSSFSSNGRSRPFCASEVAAFGDSAAVVEETICPRCEKHSRVYRHQGAM